MFYFEGREPHGKTASCGVDMTRKKWGLLSVFVAFIILFGGVAAYTTGQGSMPTVSKYGSRGEEVRRIQTKLKQWGYFSGAADGVYGTDTKNAVKAFQRKNGLKADGIAGSKTLYELGLGRASDGGSSSGAAASSGASDNDINLLARVINGEARGESYEGQVAVGAVILNRVKHPSFPNTLSGVVYQPGAFTAITDGQVHANMTASAQKAARDAMNGWDPSGGAIYYYNPAKTTNQWIYSRPVIKVIGKHRFAK